MKNFTLPILPNLIILPIIFIGLLFSAQAVYAQGLENEIKVIKPRIPVPIPVPTPMMVSTPIPTKSGNERGDGKGNGRGYGLKKGVVAQSKESC